MDRLLEVGPLTHCVSGRNDYNVGFISRRSEVRFGLPVDMS